MRVDGRQFKGWGDRHQRKRRLAAAGLTLGAVGLVTGCGAPDLASMRPTVNKTAVAVLLVNQPAAWSPAALQASLPATGKLVVQVDGVSGRQAVATANADVKHPAVHWLMWVEDGSLPSELMQWAQVHPQVQVLFVGAECTQPLPANVHALVPDPLAEAYALGWLAGAQAVAAHSAFIGWLASAAPDPDTTQAALAGLYSAAPQIQLLPVGGGVAGAGAGSGLWPHVCLAARPLTPAEQQAVTAAGVVVVALSTAADSPAVAARPGLLPPLGVTEVWQDIPSLPGAGAAAAARLTAGKTAVESAADRFDPAVLSQLTSVQSALQAGSVQPAQAWTQMPAALRQAWAATAGLSVAASG
ncbi:MAG: hypothetical protein K6T31_09080 [Alicyclobacillus sp.]|nr:hypothetical protein [Alicyclobacillus sp.]